jgi:transcription elongation factor GreB
MCALILISVAQVFMSKAFTKESDGDEDDVESPELAIPAGTKNYITPLGAQKLRDELKKLLNQDRPEVVKTVSWAASNGDRSENGDYIYGKRRLREIDRRIRFLTQRLERAEIVDPAKQSGDRILFGATVTVQDEEGRKRIYRIVGIDEADVARGHISWISPLAKALLNYKQGEVIVFRSPKGEEELEIVEVRYVAV